MRQRRVSEVERDPRVYFAAERTLLAWIRTGLAMMGFGFVVARFGIFLREVATTHGEVGARFRGSVWAGTGLVLLGVLVNVYAAWAHNQFTRRFERGEVEPQPSPFGVILASCLAVLGFGMAVYLMTRG